MIEECPERLERDSVLDLAQQMSIIQAKNKEAEALRAPPPPPPSAALSHVSLAVKGGQPPAASAPSAAPATGEAPTGASMSPPKERQPRKEKEDVNMTDTVRDIGPLTVVLSRVLCTCVCACVYWSTRLTLAAAQVEESAD